jgi:hypothetical protein
MGWMRGSSTRHASSPPQPVEVTASQAGTAKTEGLSVLSGQSRAGALVIPTVH